MPWKVFEDDGKFCVHKMKDGGEKGKKMGCHDTKEEANAQLAALNASEPKQSKSQTNSNKTSSAKLLKGQIADLLEAALRDAIEKHGDDDNKDEFVDIWVRDFDDEEGYAIFWHMGKLHKANYHRTDTSAIFEDKSKWKEVLARTVYDEKSFAIKSIGEDRIRGYAVLWGGESKKDLTKEWFDEDGTEDLLSVFKTMKALPWFLEHAGDDEVKSTVFGIIDDMGEDDAGIWYEAKVQEHEMYRKYALPLIKKNILFSSSGTFPHARRVSKSGMIERWPIAEVSGTVKPADHYQLEDAAIEHYKKSVKSIAPKVNIKEIDSFIKSDDRSEEDDSRNNNTKKKLLLVATQKMLQLKLSKMR